MILLNVVVCNVFFSIFCFELTQKKASLKEVKIKFGGKFMKKIKLVLVMVFLSLVATSCENVGLLGQGGVKGSKAKSEINAEIENSTFLGTFLRANRAGFGSAISLLFPSIFFQILVDGAIVPGLAGVNDSKHYSRKSVDDCKDQIKQMNILLSISNSSIPGVVIGSGNAFAGIPSASVIGGLQCDLKTTPALLQLGDGDTGEVIQLGPIGL